MDLGWKYWGPLLCMLIKIKKNDLIKEVFGNHPGIHGDTEDFS